MSLVLHSMQPAMKAWDAVVAQRKECLDQRDRDRERQREDAQRHGETCTHTENSKKACVVGVGTAGRGIGLAVGSRCPWAADHLPCSLD